MSLHRLFFRPHKFFEEMTEEYRFRPFLTYLGVSLIVILIKHATDAYLSANLLSFFRVEKIMRITLELGIVLAIPVMIYITLHFLLIRIHGTSTKRQAITHTLKVMYYGHAILLLYIVPLILLSLLAEGHERIIEAIGIAIGLLSIIHTGHIEVTGISHIHGLSKKKASILLFFSMTFTLILFLHYVFNLIL